MRKALLIGLDDYAGDAKLHCCHNDASALANLLKSHEDGTHNFDVNLHDGASLSLIRLKNLVKECFSAKGEISLCYFSGHGMVDDDGDTYLVSTDFAPDLSPGAFGLSLDKVLRYANESPADNRVIILDCCHAGRLGNPVLFGHSAALLKPGTTILTACRGEESAMERTALKHGLFTSLLLEALEGCAADLLGHITPGSIYTYIDKCLGSWDQRPVFKTNVDNFISLRKVNPPIRQEDLRRLPEFFTNQNAICPLDPSYEYTNDPACGTQNCIEPYANPEHVKILKTLQRLERVGLVIPAAGLEHMYEAAMQGAGCILTALGRQYWRFVRDGRI